MCVLSTYDNVGWFVVFWYEGWVVSDVVMFGQFVVLVVRVAELDAHFVRY